MGAKISVWQTGIPFEATVIVGFGGKKRVRKDCSFLMIYGKLSQLVTGWSSMWFWPHFIGSQQLHSFIPKNPQNNGKDLVTVVVSEKKKTRKKQCQKSLRTQSWNVWNAWYETNYHILLPSPVICLQLLGCYSLSDLSFFFFSLPKWSGLKIFLLMEITDPAGGGDPKEEKGWKVGQWVGLIEIEIEFFFFLCILWSLHIDISQMFLSLHAVCF